MRKNYVTMLCLAMMLVACGQQTKQKETTMEFTDQVKEALADGGRIALDSLQWTREPKDYEVKGDTILITTAPKTDLWQRTYYHFQNDNAPVLQMKTREKFFSFVVKTDFTGSHHRFDQCGIVMYLGSENWLKGSVEPAARMTTVSSALLTDRRSARCVSATCLQPPMKSASASMPARPRSPHSQPFSPI